MQESKELTATKWTNQRETTNTRQRSHLGTKRENEAKAHIEEISKRNMEMDNNHFREEQSRTRKKKDKEKYTFILLL